MTIVPSAEEIYSRDAIATLNNILAMGEKSDSEYLEIIMSNKRICEILKRYDNDKREDSMIEMARINKLIAKQVSMYTAARRFGGTGSL